MIKIKDALTYASAKFRQLSINSANLDARLLLEFILGKPLNYILINPEEILTPFIYNKFLAVVARRAKFEPISYIIGKKEFYGYEFIVNKHTLIPRPDSELLMDIAIKEHHCNFARNAEFNVLELGIGSGCIIISLLLQLPKIIGVGVDISKEALKVAHKNAVKHNVNNRLQLINSNWFTAVPNDQKFDIIISNPPYVSLSQEVIMSKETMLYEPPSALFGGNDGLDAYKIIAKNAKNYFKPSGKLILEIGVYQDKAVIELFSKHSYNLKEIKKDLAGINRVITFY